METVWEKRKVVIVGAGAVGSTFAYALAQSGPADQIVLIDKDRDFAEGQVLDLLHALLGFVLGFGLLMLVDRTRKLRARWLPTITAVTACPLHRRTADSPIMSTFMCNPSVHQFLFKTYTKMVDAVVRNIEIIAKLPRREI